jgi:hypothetical protein
VELWVDLPERDHMRVQNIATRVGGVMAANTVTYLEDGTPVNFVFKVNGLGDFDRETEHTERLKFRGQKIPVLKLERILKSKESIRRDKDLLHIIHIRNLLRCRRALKPKRKSGPSRKRSRH